MSNLHKSNWRVSGDEVRLSVPFAKVDTELRQVSGFATLDNLDNQGDVVLAEASAKAFARARGNLREMHQPIAAGHLVDFHEQDFYDPETQKFYKGIFVTAYVSKGAASTWEKVLDGTLTGFSIGGEIKEATNEFVKDADTTVRFIKDYDLVELSLVDNPANPLANVFSFQKSAEGSVTLKGMVAETVIENIFRCSNDGKVVTGSVQAMECPFCGGNMANIGWVESGEDKSEKVREAVEKAIGNSVGPKSQSPEGTNQIVFNKDGSAVIKGNLSAAHLTINTKEIQDMAKGGVTVPEETKEGEVVAGVDEVETAPETEAVAEEPTEETNEGQVVAGVDEVPDENEEIQKKMDALKNSIDESLEKTRSEATNAVTALGEKIDGFAKSMTDKLSELETKLGEYEKDLATAKSKVTTLEDSVEKVNSAGAFKKSGEVEKTEPETIQKDDDWNGAFSVKNLFS